jgi:dihydrofolate synthase/folylpolyglutamate synthase
LAKRVIAVPIAGQEKSLPPDIIADAVRRVGIPADSRRDIAEALAATNRLELDPPPRILITGSLYLAGEVLALNGTVPQ